MGLFIGYLTGDMIRTFSLDGDERLGLVSVRRVAGDKIERVMGVIGEEDVMDDVCLVPGVASNGVDVFFVETDVVADADDVVVIAVVCFGVTSALHVLGAKLCLLAFISCCACTLLASICCRIRDSCISRTVSSNDDINSSNNEKKDSHEGNEDSPK